MKYVHTKTQQINISQAFKTIIRDITNISTTVKVISSNKRAILKYPKHFEHNSKETKNS